MSSGAEFHGWELPHFSVSKAELSSGERLITKSDCNIRIRQHRHTHPLFDTPQPHKERGEESVSLFPKWSVQGSRKGWGRGRLTLSDGAGTGQSAMNQEPVGRSQTSVSFCASFCILLKSLCCSTTWTSIYLFFSPLSCQTTLIFSHFNLGRISKPNPPGEKPGLRENNLSWLNYPILLRHKEFVCFAYESQGRDGTEG